MAGLRVQASGRVARRFEGVAIDTSRSRGLDPDNPALGEGRTIFPSSVVGTMESPRFLVSGANNPKLGKAVIKGPRAGWPIFHVTLEERATCPRSCHAWASCYGNAMPFARRNRVDGDFLEALKAEVLTVARQYPSGLLVRLHTLGDFYSVDYVQAWRDLLGRLPQLHVFGYSARRRDTDDLESRLIAVEIEALRDQAWDRFAIRFSRETAGPATSIIVDEDPERPNVILCPAQVHKTEACASCGLCWADAARDKTIAFLRHGMKSSAGVERRPRLVASSDGPPRERPGVRGPQRRPTKLSIALDALRGALPTLFERFPSGANSDAIMAATGLSYLYAVQTATRLARLGEAQWVYAPTQRSGKLLLPIGKTANAAPVLTSMQVLALDYMRRHARNGVYSDSFADVQRASGGAPGNGAFLADALERKGCIRRLTPRGDMRGHLVEYEIVGEIRRNPSKSAAPAEPDPAPVAPSRPNPRPAPAYAPEPKREPAFASAPKRPKALSATWRAKRGVVDVQARRRKEVADLAPVTAFRRDAIDRREPSSVSTRLLMGDPEPGALVPSEMSADDIRRHNAKLLAKLNPSSRAELAAFDAGERP